MRLYENLLVETIGHFGRSQLLLTISLTLAAMVMAMNMIMFSIIGKEPEWWLEEQHFNFTTNETYLTRSFRKCPIALNGVVVFAEEEIQSIVSEWQLVCNKSWVPTTLATIQMVGVLFGVVLMGQLGAVFGRRKMVLVSCISCTFFVAVEGASVNWYMMSVCVFLVGSSIGGFMALAKTLQLEFIGSKYRDVLAVITLWPVGICLLGGLIKVIPYWRHLCYCSAAIGASINVILWFFLPESVRWLFTKRRFEEGKEIIIRFAKWNKRPAQDFTMFDEYLLSEDDRKKNENTYTYISLFKNGFSRWKVLVFAFQWFSMSFIYYGLTLGVGRLVGDISLNMFIMGLAETFKAVIVWGLVKWVGRKPALILLFAVTSVSSLGITITYFTSKRNFEAITVILALISRTSLSSAWMASMILLVETFPTVVRVQAFAFASTFARVGGILAPQNKTMSDILPHLPFTVNAVLSFASCVSVFFLQETRARPMLDFYNEKNDKKELNEVL